MKKIWMLAVALLCTFSLIGCKNLDSTTSKIDSIPFQEDHLYAVAYLGYEDIQDISFYTEQFLDHEDIPIHHVSAGEYYLILPRYSDMTLRLFKNNMMEENRTLFYETTSSEPFIIQCNVSDIFPDIVVQMTYQDEVIEFSPYISLVDGSVQVGDKGLDITQ